jgi:dTMP kinase
MKRFFGQGIPNVDPRELTGSLIVIEGADGSGRSTQIDRVRNWLEREGYPTADVGLKRSTLVADELELAMDGNTLTPTTLSLFYATDFADQLENKIIPALRAGFIVLADRYIYTLIARDLVRGGSSDWIRRVYSIALVPDAVFYLSVTPRILAERNLRKRGVLDFWESGMDIKRQGDMYECFVRYQRAMRKEFSTLQEVYGFREIDGNRTPDEIFRDMQSHIAHLLGVRIADRLLRS